MSLPRYGEYKESRIPWLGEVPSHWEVERFKWLVDRNDGGVWGDEPDGIDDTVVLRSTEQTVDGRWRIDDPAMRKLSEWDRLSALLIEGDLLLTKSSGSALHIGKTTLVDKGVAELNACYSNFMQRIRVQRKISPKIAWYILNNGLARVQLDLLSSSTTGLANLNGAMIGELVVPTAPADEQAVIVDFLDRETAKIDALIAEQEKLLALLAEKRRATISHAVTRGLDPNAPMKDSGIPWLGKVPAHWRVTKCGRLLSILSGFAFPSSGYDRSGHGARLLRGVNVTVGALRWDDVVYWERSPGDGLEDYELKIGDLVIGMDRPLIAAGIRVAKVKGEDLPCLLLQRVALLRTFSDLASDFLMHYLSTPMFVAHFSPDTTGVSVPHISPDQIASFVVAVPPAGEQQQIVEHLQEELARLGLLRDQAERAIDLLKERRSALIAAATTGKVDVRGMVEVKVA